MKSTLIVWLFLVTNAVSKSIAPTGSLPTTKASTKLDLNAEYAKLQEFCLTTEDIEELNNIPNYKLDNIYHYDFNDFANINFQFAIQTMGLDHIRRRLNLAPLPMPLNETEPSLEEIHSAATAEEYFNLKDQLERIQYSHRFDFLRNEKKTSFENTTIPTIEFLDKRVPSIRKLHRHLFDSIVRYGPDVNQKQTFFLMLEWFNTIPIGWFFNHGSGKLACKPEADTENIENIYPIDINYYYSSISSATLGNAVYDVGSKLCPCNITDNMFTYKTPNVTLIRSMEPTLDAIGIHELRTVLNFAPETRNALNFTGLFEALEFAFYLPVNFFLSNHQAEPSYKEATSLREYYCINEPMSIIWTLDHFYKSKKISVEHNLNSSVTYFDEHYPEIRRIFRVRFQEMREGDFDKNMIRRMIEEFHGLTAQFLFNSLIHCGSPYIYQ